MRVISKIILAILLLLYCFLFVHFKLWEPLFDRSKISDTILASAAVIILTGLITCAIFLLTGKKQARKWFIFFNLPYLAFGLYVMQFAWTFWIFKTPTLMDRIKAIAAPLLVGVVIPIAVVLYFLKFEKK
jgi:hypothetical protein